MFSSSHFASPTASAQELAIERDVVSPPAPLFRASARYLRHHRTGPLATDKLREGTK